MVNETVGAKFSLDLLRNARDKALEVILETSKAMQPGIFESEARKMILEIQSRRGAPTSWHPPQIRFGENTLLPFGVKSLKDLCLKKEDIFFFDIGPIFENHEGDIGRTFSIGSNTEIKKCCEDAENIWWEVRDHWHHQGVSGRDLYKFAQSAADRRGWNLSLHEANGHRIADFPHAARARGTIEALELAPSADRWILEIQIRHPLKPFGAFYEDLLN